MSVCQNEERSVKAGKTESTGVCVSPQKWHPIPVRVLHKGEVTQACSRQEAESIT